MSEPNAVAAPEAEVVVLLVDDQAMIGEAVRRALAGDPGIRFHFCAEAARALDTAAAIGPDVILQDLVMPGIDGMTLLRDYLSDARTRDVPVIVLSSKEDPAVKSEAFAAGAHDYLVKLPDRVELIARVRHHGAAHRSRQQRDAAYAALAASERLLAQRNGELQQLNERLAGAQTQLLQAEKMASVGQLAAGVAHEINNPIGFVLSNIGSLQRYLESLLMLVDAYEQLEPGFRGEGAERAQLAWVKQRVDLPFLREDAGALFAETLDGITRVRKIVNDLMLFSHVDESEWQPVDLHAALDSTLHLLDRSLQGRIEVSRDYGALPAVECQPRQINHVLVNVLTNAIEAIAERGQLRIRTSSDGDQVLVQIRDDGRGIPAEVLPRIFEPFFTTKPVGAGTGLGLSVAYGTMRQHGGRIEVESEPGRGTEVTLRLPIRNERGAAG